MNTNSAINENSVNIPENIVRKYPLPLSGGMWGAIDLTYNEKFKALFPVL